MRRSSQRTPLHYSADTCFVSSGVASPRQPINSDSISGSSLMARSPLEPGPQHCWMDHLSACPGGGSGGVVVVGVILNPANLIKTPPRTHTHTHTPHPTPPACVLRARPTSPWWPVLATTIIGVMMKKCPPNNLFSSHLAEYAQRLLTGLIANCAWQVLFPPRLRTWGLMMVLVRLS